MGGSRGHQRGDGGLHLRAVDRELRAAPRLRPVHSPEVGGEPRSLRGGAPQRAAQQALIVLWGGVIPALLAGLALRYLVPRAATVGLPGMVTVLGHRFGTYFARASSSLTRSRAHRCCPRSRRTTTSPATSSRTRSRDTSQRGETSSCFPPPPSPWAPPPRACPRFS